MLGRVRRKGRVCWLCSAVSWDLLPRMTMKGNMSHSLRCRGACRRLVMVQSLVILSSSRGLFAFLLGSRPCCVYWPCLYVSCNLSRMPKILNSVEMDGLTFTPDGTGCKWHPTCLGSLHIASDLSSGSALSSSFQGYRCSQVCARHWETLRNFAMAPVSGASESTHLALY